MKNTTTEDLLRFTVYNKNLEPIRYKSKFKGNVFVKIGSKWVNIKKVKFEDLFKVKSKPKKPFSAVNLLKLKDWPDA